jgi:monofunctional biosynthetic peptidoglycan transglycosylase
MRVENGVAVFKGNVSLENNGGFASTRSTPADHDLSGYEGLVLRVQGDGKRYGVRLRTSRAFDGVNYQAEIQPPANEWRDIRVPFADFEPVFRGRSVPSAPPLDPGQVRTFGFLIAWKQEGTFRFEVARIGAYSAPPDDG